ncbi:MAG: hypothetical protein IPJ30_03595 [Acidobacteria bacterium]|nr:hypothetical protein [Acidobacteriota bacterium]
MGSGILRLRNGYILNSDQKISKKLRRLSFLGIAIPVVVGGIFVAFFGIDQMKPFLGGLIIIAAVLSTVQVVFTVWSFIAKWEDQAIYGSEASVENYQIARLYEELAKYDPVDFDSKYDLLNVRNQMRSIEDGKKEITEPEKEWK